MIQKAGKCLADWTDENGKRKRHACDTEEQARSYTLRMREESKRKKVANLKMGLQHQPRKSHRKKLINTELRKLLPIAIADARQGNPGLLKLVVRYLTHEQNHQKAEN